MQKEDGWKTLSSETGFQGKFLKVRVDRVERPDGSIGTYEMVEKPDFVVVIPKIGDKFYLVNQYRYPVNSRSWEFPQGGCEGISDLESCAKKELEEELGFQAKNLTFLGNLWLAVGNSTQGCGIFLTEAVTQGKQELEESETDLITGLFTEQEIVSMIKSGEIRSSTTVAAFGLYQLNKSK